MRKQRHILYVTGSRAEFGLMSSTLRAIDAHASLKLQLVVTGMHLDRRLGYSLDMIRKDGWQVDAVVPWASRAGRTAAAEATGCAIAALTRAYATLNPDIVLVCGDRVEAFAAASAAHISGITVAHVHGGDRALGQVDDALRHAITKLSHVHLAATRESARRIRRLGEDPWRIHVTGSPGNDAIGDLAAPWDEVHQHFPGLGKREYATLVYHPASADSLREGRRANAILQATKHRYAEVVVLNPNNDPGCEGILHAWQDRDDRGVRVVENLNRPLYLGLLAHSAVLVGNSSSGLIEAPALGVPVIDVGDRQKGRERARSVIHATNDPGSIAMALDVATRRRPCRRGQNPYGGSGASRRIATILAQLDVGERSRKKLIAY